MQQPDSPKHLGRRNPRLTRDSLIAAGTDVFAEHGFDGATVERIARRARVNKAMISYHFGGKASLYRAILLSTFAPTLGRLKTLQESDAAADVQLREFVKVFSDMVAQRPSLPVMILREVLSGGRHLDKKTLPCFLAVFAAVREIVEKGTREGTFRPVDPLLTHLSLVGSLVFFFATAPLRERLFAEGWVPRNPPAASAYVLHVQDLMARALAADPAPPGNEVR